MTDTEDEPRTCQHTVYVPDSLELTTMDLMDPDGCTLCHRDYDEHHHTSYRPEKLMAVCDTCHNRIHHEPGYYDELQPNDTRPHDYTSSFKNAIGRFTRRKESILQTCQGGQHEFINICLHCDTSKPRLKHLGLLSVGRGDSSDE